VNFTVPPAPVVDAVNADGSPSEIVSAGYKWAPGSELKLKAA